MSNLRKENGNQTATGAKKSMRPLRLRHKKNKDKREILEESRTRINATQLLGRSTQ